MVNFMTGCRVHTIEGDYILSGYTLDEAWKFARELEASFGYPQTYTISIIEL